MDFQSRESTTTTSFSTQANLMFARAGSEVLIDSSIAQEETLVEHFE